MHCIRSLLRYLPGLIACVAVACGAAAAETNTLDPHLESLRPFLGRTWKGAFKDSKPEKPAVDIQRWERALNGKAVRVLHSFNNGVYGGETLFVWDAKQQTIAYYYFTTAGFMTTGKLTVEQGKIITHEEVKGDSDGVVEVRGLSELLPDGKFHVKADYLKKGEWVPGHEAIYQEDASASVIFR